MIIKFIMIYECQILFIVKYYESVKNIIHCKDIIRHYSSYIIIHCIILFISDK